MAAAPLKVSYCTTCRGRLHHLRETLPANMEAEKYNPNVEFVVLDYGSDDGLSDWIKTHYAEEMESGRLRYVRHEAENFKMAHAKNMAHRAATGDVLVNVDADNFIAPDFSHWLNKQYAQDRHAIVTCQLTSIGEDVSRKFNRATGRTVTPLRSIGGRIALRRDDFERLGGYDEQFAAWGEEDVNLVLRGRSAGLDMIKLPAAMIGDAIQHGHDERIAHYTAQDQATSIERLARGKAQNTYHQYRRLLAKPQPVANDGNVGCGEVHVNFADEATSIKPVAQHKFATTPANYSVSDLRTDWAATHGARTHPQIGPNRR